MHSVQLTCAHILSFKVSCDYIPTFSVRVFVCANELLQQLRTVFIRWGTSDMKKRGRFSGLYTLTVLYTTSPSLPDACLCILKNFRFTEAPSAVVAMTFRPHVSNRLMHSHTSGKKQYHLKCLHREIEHMGIQVH